MRTEVFRLQCANRIPKELQEHVLYVSFECNVTVHLCACGCGEKVVLPINPDCWSIQYNGEEVSLFPSIGNYQFPCRSHYWIRNNKVVWAGREKDCSKETERPRRKPTRKKRNMWEQLRHFIKAKTS